MKGFLLGDLREVKSGIHLKFVAKVAALSIVVSLLTSAWTLMVIGTAVLGICSLITINNDKVCDRCRVGGDLSEPERGAVVDSKYVLYILLCLVGFLLGGLASIPVSLLMHGFDVEDMLIFAGVSFEMSMLAGSVAIPCAIILDEKLNRMCAYIAYPMSAIVFAGTTMFWSIDVAWWVGSCISTILYVVSWNITRNGLTYREEE